MDKTLLVSLLLLGVACYLTKAQGPGAVGPPGPRPPGPGPRPESPPAPPSLPPPRLGQACLPRSFPYRHYSTVSAENGRRYNCWVDLTLTRCSGTCPSSYYTLPQTYNLVRSCSCCQPTGQNSRLIRVVLTCPSGVKIDVKRRSPAIEFLQPTSCTCRSC